MRFLLIMHVIGLASETTFGLLSIALAIGIMALVALLISSVLRSRKAKASVPNKSPES